MNTGPFLIMIAASLWAVDALIRTPLTRILPATNIVFWEHAIGLFLLSPILWKSRQMFSKLDRSDWLTIIALTMVSSIGGTILFTLALEKSFATGDFVTPLLLQKTQPLIVIALSALFLKETITKRFLLLAPLAIIGGYIMSFGFTPPQLALAGRELVFALALGAAAAWGSGTILSKKLLNKLSYTESTCIRFLAAVPLGFLTAAAFGQTPSLSSLTPEVLVRFIAIGLTTGAAALLLYYRGLAWTKAHVSTISELSFPLVSILIAITPLNPYGAAQTLTLPTIVGITLLLTSVIAISLEYAKKTAVITIAGAVVRGDGEGRKLGIPTANIKSARLPTIPFGVYAVRAAIGSNTYAGVLHFGPRLVFDKNIPQIEVHLLNFKGNLYGKTMTVTIKKYIRSTQKFSSVESMMVQIHKDIRQAKRLLK